MDETKSGMSWLWVLFVILVIWLVMGGVNVGNRGWGGDGWGYGYGRGHGCDCVSNCDVEKRELIDSARTQYLIEQQGAQTRTAYQQGVEAIMAQNSRIYEQGLQEKIFDLKAEVMSLKNNAFTKEQTDAIAKQLAECCCGFNRRLDGIECNMLRRPALYGLAVTTNGQLIPPIPEAAAAAGA